MRKGFKEVPGFPGYWISRSGELRSQRHQGKILPHRWWRRVPRVDKRGRPYVNMSRDGVTYTRRIHWLVARTFLGPCPPGLEICHEDGDPANNCVENLRYDTHRANLADRIRHGTHRVGEQSPHAKLSEADVGKVRSWLALGFQQTVIAQYFGVNHRTIGRIGRRETWAHVPEQY